MGSGETAINNYSNMRVAPAVRLRQWNDLYANSPAPVEIKARDRNAFEASASAAELGPLHFARIASTPATVEHAPRHVAQTRAQQFRILLSARGRLRLRHMGQDVTLDEGDFALLQDSAPYRIDFDEPNTSFCVAIAPATLKVYLSDPTRMCGFCMSARRPLNRVASTMLRALWIEITDEDLQPDYRPALARSLLQVMAASYAVDHASDAECSRMIRARFAEIKQYIETNLRNPELNPRTIAAALGLSDRYLRLLFAAESETLTAYLRRRRLEECAFELAQAQWRGRSITATATEWGFRSVTHFARAFKKAYGETPSAFKQAHNEARRR